MVGHAWAPGASRGLDTRSGTVSVPWMGGRAMRRALPITTALAILILCVCLPAAAAAQGSSPSGALGRAADAPVFAPSATGAPGLLPASPPLYTGHRAPPSDLSYLMGRRLGIERHFYASTYDLRTLNRLTPVRDQSPHGTCWAFAAIGSLESNLARDGVTQWDFSEDNVVWFSGFDASGDPYDNGGFSFMALAYLARWGGPVLESDDPYDDDVHPTGLTVRKHLQEAVFVPPRSSSTDNDAIKAAVMDYGGVDVDLYMSENAAYWKDATDSFYYTGSSSPNHDVVIVGWDDGYAAGNFPSPPLGNGAFLVRNSWGTAWGASGYFYVSYYDTKLGRGFCNMTFDLAEGTSNYTGVYQYDPLGFWPEDGPNGNSTGWFANVFTATSSDPVAAVAFYTPLANCGYEVSIGSSIAAAQLKKSGTIATPGYHTVVLDTPVAVTSGQPFAAVVKLTVPDVSYHDPIPVEVPYPDYSDATANPGESFISWNGTTWQDLTSIAGYSEANVCLKAFTTTAGPVAPTVTAPNGAETWVVSSNRTITWNPGNGGAVMIELSRDNGAGWGTLYASTANDGSESWTVSGPVTSQALVRISNANGSDTSNATFTISDAAVDDDEVPGVPVPVSPISGTLANPGDRDDVYAVQLGAGDLLEASIDGAPGTDFDLFLFPPGTSTVQEGSASVAACVGTSYPDGFAYVARGAGTYYLDVWAYVGSGWYTVTYTVTPDTTDPVTRAWAPGTAVKRFRSGTIRYRLEDQPSQGQVYAQLIVKKRSGGQVVKRVNLGWKAVNVTLKYRLKCSMKKGRYRVYIAGTTHDRAGRLWATAWTYRTLTVK